MCDVMWCGVCVNDHSSSTRRDSNAADEWRSRERATDSDPIVSAADDVISSLIYGQSWQSADENAIYEREGVCTYGCDE